MNIFQIGQRWISEMEPGLGLGIVVGVEKHAVDIRFPASRCQRRYALPSAPLRRVEFRIGDTISSRLGHSFKITAITKQDELLLYQGVDAGLSESDLSDQLSFTTPSNRLQSGFIDRNRDFNLRYRALVFQHNSRKSEVRGFIGGRIDLIPHQLYVAHEIVSRAAPRVLLSDETGLGKTIEACLILHHLLLNGRIERVLIVLPDTLVHQWFIELYRKFSLFFRIFDEEYCLSLEETDPHNNPFLDDQLAICSVDFFMKNARRAEQALAAGWDILVIDEAHHLTEESADYALAAKLSAICNYIILLTATPEQLGHKSHFARLLLLDPARYSDFNLFEQEEKRYLKISGLVDKLYHHTKLTGAELEMLKKLLPEKESQFDKNLHLRCEQDGPFADQLMGDLLDRHGTGRSVFRNTRTTMAGFPQRAVHMVPLAGKPSDLQEQTAEFQVDQDQVPQKKVYDYKNDPRILWLVHFLREKKDRKVLLICRSVHKVSAIEEALRKRIKIELALFHEKISLLQRDRYAAWFAKTNGAQICLCSEIGSEGRNFQFAHHLVLFDLPMDPELLEQRIGRLDRIGQTETIHIHVPYLIGSEYEVLARWYHEGLKAFERNVPGVYQIYQKLGAQIKQLTELKQVGQLDAFREKAEKQCRDISAKIQKGRDRLLELNSFRPQIAARLLESLRAVDEKTTLEKFMLDVFDLYDLRVHPSSERTYRINTQLLSDPEFPLPMAKDEEFTVTFDRKTACRHEDIEFLTWDHPMVLGVLDLFLGSEKGNCTIAVWRDADSNNVLLETIFILECVAPGYLNVDRFLPPRPVRVLVNQELEDCGDLYSAKAFSKNLKEPAEKEMALHAHFQQDQFTGMLEKCHYLAAEKTRDIIASSLATMESHLSQEKIRLIMLRKINQNIKEEEIISIQQQMVLLNTAIQSARLRLDSLRVIHCIPFS